jgi:hypothetical protein
MSPWGKTLWISEVMIGGTGGTAGWIIGAAANLEAAGRRADANMVWLCVAGVFATGGILWLLLMTGRKLSVLLVAEPLLAASFIFGALALWILHLRGALAFAVDPAGKYPEWLAWAALPLLLVIMAVMAWESARRRQRHRTSEDVDSTEPLS